MTAPAATSLTLEHRAAQQAISRETAGAVLRLWKEGDPQAIESAWPVLSRAIANAVDQGFAASVKTASQYIEAHARVHGHTLAAIKAGVLNVDQVATALRVTGPVAVKTAAGRGMAPRDAFATAAVQIVGAGMRLAMLGGRETINGTIDGSREVLGYRRVGRGTSCKFCSLLIGRGAVYKSHESASGVVGRKGRARGEREIGYRYHDHCDCQSEPLYVGDAEPLDVEAHRAAYYAGTAPPSPDSVLLRDIAGDSDDALSELLGTVTSDAEADRIVAELDRRDAIAAEAAAAEAKRAAVAEKRRAARDAKRAAELDAKRTEYARLVDAGDDPETAYEDVYGVTATQQRRNTALASLRSNGYQGRNFDELSRDAFRDHVAEAFADAESFTKGHWFKGVTNVNETRNPRRLFDGSEAYARANASEELLAYWRDHGRLTLADMRASLLGEALHKGTAAWL